jgi:hypothetical protein
MTGLEVESVLYMDVVVYGWMLDFDFEAGDDIDPEKLIVTLLSVGKDVGSGHAGWCTLQCGKVSTQSVRGVQCYQAEKGRLTSGRLVPSIRARSQKISSTEIPTGERPREKSSLANASPLAFPLLALAFASKTFAVLVLTTTEKLCSISKLKESPLDWGNDLAS